MYLYLSVCLVAGGCFRFCADGNIWFSSLFKEVLEHSKKSLPPPPRTCWFLPSSTHTHSIEVVKELWGNFASFLFSGCDSCAKKKYSHKSQKEAWRKLYLTKLNLYKKRSHFFSFFNRQNCPYYTIFQNGCYSWRKHSFTLSGIQRSIHWCCIFMVIQWRCYRF